MRKINPNDFQVARRSTAGHINRQIVLNIVREHQPISRADLARRMNTTRGIAGKLVNQLIAERLIYEGEAGTAARGRRPVSLHVRTHDRLVVSADVRVSRIDVMLSDFAGRQLIFDTLDAVRSPGEFVQQFARWTRGTLRANRSAGTCEGIGIVVPGMVDRETGRVINTPQFGWRDVDIRGPLAKAAGLPVVVESAGKACALAQMWLSPKHAPSPHDFVFISVSDGVGAGLVVSGELVRGHNQIAGEFGHIPVSLDGPACACGARGCWMAYVSNLATVARYRDTARAAIRRSITISDLIGCARQGDSAALEALQTTARYLGFGLVTIIHGFDPARIYIGGEITTAWDLIEPLMRASVLERALTPAAGRTDIRPSSVEYPRLRGAAALIAAPTFAAPRVA